MEFFIENLVMRNPGPRRPSSLRSDGYNARPSSAFMLEHRFDGLS
jgi:hypothetical protein